MKYQTKHTDAKIPKIGEIPTGERPSVSLSLTIKRPPSPELLRYLTESVGPSVSEVVVTAAYATPCLEQDRPWQDDLRSACPRLVVVPVTPDTHPRLYASGAEYARLRSRPLASEAYEPPMAGQQFVRDWSAVRNLGWSACSSGWCLALTEDDVIGDPQKLVGVCWVLESERRDSAYVQVRYADGRHVLSLRLARKLHREIGFEGSAAESLEGCLRPAVLSEALGVRNASRLSDPSCGSEIFKVLYTEARLLDWAIPPVNLLHLARTAPYSGMTEYYDFARRAVDTYLDSSQFAEERSWAKAIRGELEEARESFAEASRWYEQSLTEHPNWKSALRLCCSRHRERAWSRSLDAWAAYLAHKDELLLVDDGRLDPRASLVFVASSLHELGRQGEAATASKMLRELFPSVPSILALCDEIERQP